MAKDEQIHVLILLALLIDIALSLHLTLDSATRIEGEMLMVVCRDEGGQSVTWRGPKGVLNARTRPVVQLATYGTSIFFNRTKIEDTGNYTCMLTDSPQVKMVFQLKVEEGNTLPTSTENEHLIEPNYTDNEEDYDDYEPIKSTTTEIVVKTITENNIENVDTTTEEPQITSTEAVEKKKNRYNKQYTNSLDKISPQNSGRRKIPERSQISKRKLKFINAPKEQIAEEGKSFILECQVNLKDVRRTFTLVNGESLDKKYEIVDQGLFFRNLTREDAQIYQCQVESPSSGSFITRNITLIVRHKPVLPYSIFAEEEEVYAFLGEAVNLTCEVEANPPPRFQWHHRGMGEVINISSHVSVLQLNVTDKTPGTYRCTAYNMLGQLKKFFDVQLGEHPDKPTSIEVEKATGDSLELKIEVPDIPYNVRDPVMDPQWIVVQYKPVSEEEWYSKEFNISSESFTLTDLLRNTEYEIQAATKNIAGLSEYYFNNTIFKTSPATSVHTKLPIVTYLTIIVLIPMFG